MAGINVETHHSVQALAYLCMLDQRAVHVLYGCDAHIFLDNTSELTHKMQNVDD